jgi:mannose-6-phosphate isomerase-like protein (cupin superfamily)
MKLLIILAVLTPLFADDPLGFVVWKSSDLKQATGMRELNDAGDYQTIVVNRVSNGEPELSNKSDELLVVESGEATLVVGGKVEGASIEGGQQTALSEGDVVHIPPNFPHQVLVAAGKHVTYLEIKRREEPPDPEAAKPIPPTVPSGPKPEMGIDLGSGFRACVASDTTPAGTVVDGYRKVINHGFMGRSCLWESIIPEQTTAGSLNPKAKPGLGTDMGEGFRSCTKGDDSPSGTIVDGYRKVSHDSPFGLSCAWEKIK